jgi:hypothetical protein
MKTDSKHKKAARKIAEIMHESLQQFSDEEQQKKIKEVEKIASKIGIKPTGKPSKRSSTRATRPSRRRSATAR